jgi:hypothetical protein
VRGPTRCGRRHRAWMEAILVYDWSCHSGFCADRRLVGVGPTAATSSTIRGRSCAWGYCDGGLLRLARRYAAPNVDVHSYCYCIASNSYRARLRTTIPQLIDDFTLYAYVRNDPLNQVDPCDEQACNNQAERTFYGIPPRIRSFDARRDTSRSQVVRDVYPIGEACAATIRRIAGSAEPSSIRPASRRVCAAGSA